MKAGTGIAHNYPEPFSRSSTISYSLPQEAEVRLTVFDILGRRVATLVNERQDTGHKKAVFDGSDLPPGVYFYRIEIGHASATRSMMLVK